MHLKFIIFILVISAILTLIGIYDILNKNKYNVPIYSSIFLLLISQGLLFLYSFKVKLKISERVTSLSLSLIGIIITYAVAMDKKNNLSSKILVSIFTSFVPCMYLIYIFSKK